MPRPVLEAVRTRVVPAIILVAVGLVAACGGGSDDDEESADTVAPATAAERATTPEPNPVEAPEEGSVSDDERSQARVVVASQEGDGEHTEVHFIARGPRMGHDTQALNCITLYPGSAMVTCFAYPSERSLDVAAVDDATGDVAIDCWSARASGAPEEVGLASVAAQGASVTLGLGCPE